MVAHVLRLRLALLLGASRSGGPRALLGLALVTLAAAASVTALVQLRDAPTASTVVVLAVAGAATTAGFALVPLLAPVRDPLDPRAFSMTGAGWSMVAASTLVAMPVSIPSLATIVVSVAAGYTWTAHGSPVGVSVAAATLLALTLMLTARVSMGVAAIALAERRSRELTALFLLALAVITIPVAVFLASLDWGDGVPGPLQAAADIVALTPIGAIWVLPLVLTPLTLVFAVLTPVLLAAAWLAIVRRMLTATERPVSVRERRGLGWFTVTPGTPGGAIAARAIVYWMRDPRYLVDVAIIPVAAVITVVPLVIVGVPIETAALIPAPVIALFLGWLVHNDLAYDGSAVWLHVSSAVRGAADRAGRLVPLVLVALPLLAVAVSVGVGVHGDWSALPAMSGVCAALLFGGMGLASIASVTAPYAVARPGESPFQQPQRTGGAATQGVVLLGAVLVALPSLWWGWQFLQGVPDAHWWALGTGVGAGLFVLAVGIVVGGAVFDRRGDRVMAFAETT